MKTSLNLFLVILVQISFFAAESFGQHKQVKQDSIYGDDGRGEAWEFDTMPMIAKVASATALLVRRSDIYKIPVNAPDEPARCRIAGRTLKDRFQLCANERFADQPSTGYCSGVLVGTDRLLTAGHCMRSATDCANTAVVFDFAVERGRQNRDLSVPATNVFVCTSIIVRVLEPDSGIDYAVIRLNRWVEDREPVALRRTGLVSSSSELAVVGHQSGLPLKVAVGGRVRNNQLPGYFVASLDVTDGSSGSPVVDLDTGLVEGIVVRGESAFTWAPISRCNRTRLCLNHNCRGEDVTRATAIQCD